MPRKISVDINRLDGDQAIDLMLAVQAAGEDERGRIQALLPFGVLAADPDLGDLNGVEKLAAATKLAKQFGEVMGADEDEAGN